LNMLGDKMYPYFGDYVRLVAESRQIEIGDVRAIRAVLHEEVAADRVIIEKLIELDRAAEGCTEWREFLAETVADYIVWVEGRMGEVSSEASAWLVGALRGSGAIAPSAASIVHAVITQAEETDGSLSLFALSMPCASSWTRPGTRAWERAADFVM
jgi:hypothetical protein